MSAPLSATEKDWLFDFPPQRSLPLDQEALSVFERAYYLGLKTEKDTEPPITFSTLALALLVGKDETSQWFAQTAKFSGPKFELIRNEKSGLADDALFSDYRSGKPQDLRLSDDKQLLTASARAVLETAEEWASRVGGSDIGVRHLVAVYVLNPPAAHRKQMNDWGFQEATWRSLLFDWAGQRYTAESWLDAKSKLAPTKAVASFEQVKVKGAALAFHGDAQVTQVLDCAAEFHTRQPDTWLRLQTVLFSLVEQIRFQAALREVAKPIWGALQKTQEKYDEALLKFRTAFSIPKELVAFESLDISPRVLNGLETARGLARAAPAGLAEVGLLELAAALLSRRVDSDEEWAAMGFDPQTLRLELINHAITQGVTAETWREALGEEEAVTVGRPVELNSDEPEAVVRSDEKWTSDPLGIRPDVASFAALLAAKSLEPPLAIGLFGPWGSGKTTFLKRLRRAIDERATKPRADEKDSSTQFVSNVVHVEFNAWHFAEEALISSLVETIARELRSFIKQDNPPIGEALANLKSETADDARRKAAEAKQKEADARKNLATAQELLARSEAKARQGAATVQAAVQGAWKTTLAAIKASKTVQSSGVLNQLSASVTGLDELQQRLNAVRSRPGRLLGDLGWWWTIAFAAAVLVFPALLTWGATKLLALAGVQQALTSLGAMLSIVVLWLRSASAAVSQVDQAISKVVASYEKQICEDVHVQQATQSLVSANEEIAKATANVAKAEGELTTAEAEAAAVSFPAQMLTLVSGRMDDRTYAKELTTISTARADLQRLSQLLREQRSKAEAELSSVRTVDRVVLYIDDLDRCKPEDVVRVLQVVHMLLAFELFVVVVAVDARWVEESLKHNYSWLADAQAPDKAAARFKNPSGVTPQDYLEKIFQISFWLEPMTATRAAEYLKSLARTARHNSVPPSPTPTGSDATEIRILPIELDYMRVLATYVGPSPRRVKRLVNAYRLLKARLSDGQLKSFVTDRNTGAGQPRSGPYQLAIGLLVIGTGAPTEAAQILGELAQRNPADAMNDLIEAFRQRKHRDWTMAAQVLETLSRTQKAKDVSEIRGWARRVGRFLLQGPADILSQRSATAAETNEVVLSPAQPGDERS